MSGSIERRKNQKVFLKEKVLQVYDKLFQGQDITQGRADFWDDFFLLKANIKCLTAHFEKLSQDDLIRVKPQLNRLLFQCIHTAHQDKHRIRVVNAIQTMDALISGVFRCKQSSDSPSANASEYLIAPDQMREFMECYITLCADAFHEDRPELLRSMVLISMRSFATASSTVHTNPFAIGLVDDRVLDTLRLCLINAQLRYHHGTSACKLFGLLLRFNNCGTDHSTAQQMQLLDDELLLNGVSSTISLALSEFNLRFCQQHDPSVGIIASVSSFFGTLFVGDVSSNVSLRPCDSLLFCMYAIAKSNTHFSILLSYSNAHCASTTNGFESIISSTATSSESKLSTAFSSDCIPLDANTNQVFGERDLNGDSDTGTLSLNDSPRHFPADSQHNITATTQHDVPSSRTCSPLGMDEVAMCATSNLEPRNLLADLLEYCSIVMQDVKAPESLNSCQLCFIIVFCITQNPVACSILHDPHVTFKVRIHKQRSRYRKSGSNACENFNSRSIAVAILSLIVEFIRGHLMKKLPARTYSLALSICHNLLTYEKKHNIRLDFDWKQLWSALLSLLQFVLNLDSNVLPLITGLGIMHQILQLFNFCILHGDSFLQAAEVYDDLYYELIRMHSLFENVYEHCLVHSTGSNEDVKVVACHAVLQIGNIRSIVNHFNAKIVAFSAANNLTSLTEQQVLAVVREHYDSLNLRVHDNLDIPEVYNEADDQVLFDTLMDTVIKQTRKECLDSSLQMQTCLHELSSIH